MIVTKEELKEILTRLRTENKTIVFTNGCFDILHKGHIYYLNESANLGDVLIVGLNSDSSIKKIKGQDRPINDQSSRAEVLSALRFVDYVVLFDEETPYNLINFIKPTILVKGGDYKLNDIVGADIVQDYGGKVVTIPYLDGNSTTEIIEKIKNKC